MEALGVQLRSTEWEIVCEPFPEREIVAGELVALLVTVTVPGKTPATSGAKDMSNVADCPGARIKPPETPLVE